MKCEDSRLLDLLQSVELTDAFDETVEHLNTCVACRQRLEVLAADPQWWSELASLSDPAWDRTPNADPSVVIALDPSLGADLPAVCDVVSLGFLEQPRQPDLLGRLGRYDVERVIGSGGMGVVLKAFDSELHRYVAIKVLKAHLADNGAARQRFAREAQAAAAIAHASVMPIHDVQSEAELPYLVMPLVTGESLQHRVDRSGPLTVEEALGILRQTAGALAAAHEQGIIHRDVKPANILLEEGGRVLLSDFGLARAVDDTGMTRTGVVAGTPHYMSPEQASGDAVDVRSDLYSLGSVFYFMLCGQPPHTRGGAMAILHAICQRPHAPITRHRDNLAQEVEALSELLLAKPLDERPQSGEAVQEICERLIRERCFHSQASNVPLSPSDAAQAASMGARVRWGVWGVGAMAAACLLVLGFAVGQWTESLGRLDEAFGRLGEAFGRLGEAPRRLGDAPRRLGEAPGRGAEQSDSPIGSLVVVEGAPSLVANGERAEEGPLEKRLVAGEVASTDIGVAAVDDGRPTHVWDDGMLQAIEREWGVANELLMQWHEAGGDARSMTLTNQAETLPGILPGQAEDSLWLDAWIAEQRANRPYAPWEPMMPTRGAWSEAMDELLGLERLFQDDRGPREE